MSATAIPTGESEAQAPQAVAETATSAKIFKYSEFVDIGDGAAECEHARDGQCEEPTHFHAWCRIPNRYQEEDIRNKAMAAKARQVRAMKDPESDLGIVLDSELQPLNDERFRETLIDELVGEELATDYIEAQTDVREREEYEHIDQDQEEHERLKAQEGELPEAEQCDEFRRLTAHVQSYLEAIGGHLKEVQEPRRLDLRERPFEALFEQVRAKRVDQEATRAFMGTYNAWTCYVGTFSPQLHETLHKPYLPRWEEIGHRDRAGAGTMFGEEPDVIAVLDGVFRGLRDALRKGSTGN
jgi:hypothetical protein